MERKPKLVISKGHPGTGKSTLCQALSEKTGFEIIDRDKIKLELFRAATPIPELGFQSYRVMWDQAIGILQTGNSVICDTSLNQPSDLARIDAISRLTKSDITVIEVVCSDQPTHQSRLDSRPQDADSERIRINSWAKYLEWRDDPQRNINFAVPYPLLRVDSYRPFNIDEIAMWIDSQTYNPDFTGDQPHHVA